MRQVRIYIKDVIGTSNAIIQKFGIQVFDKTSEIISQGDSAILDFDGITNLTSGFCNSSIGQIYTKFPTEAPVKVSIENIKTNSVWFEKINDAIELAQKPEKAKIIDDAILALFE
ncbi:STAS-like domain-containing protein [Mangrovibacterium sp.]|uniref:STAS-like domain-containing protein n=1 Tax=Mangrovibacterium sp. TaxID=1961364 RepID=UPI0035617E53